MARLVPGPDLRTVLEPRSRLLWNWNADECDLADALGNVATLTRSATGAATTSDGTSRTVANNAPRWHWVDTDGDTVRETVTLRLGQASGNELILWQGTDLLPSQSLTGVVRFVEGGAVGVASAGVWYYGNNGATAARLYIDSSGTRYRITHHNGTSSVTSTATVLPTAGQLVTLRWQYNGATGAVRIWQTIGTGSEVAAAVSAGLAPAATWGGTIRRLASVGTANRGTNEFVFDVGAEGLQSLATMLAAY